MAMELKPVFRGVRPELLATLSAEDQEVVKAVQRLVLGGGAADDKGAYVTAKFSEQQIKVITRELKVLDTNLGRLPDNGGFRYVHLREDAVNDRKDSALFTLRKIKVDMDIEAELAKAKRRPAKKVPALVGAARK